MNVLENTPAAWSGRASLPSHEACGWSERGQFARFMAVSSHLRLHEGQSVLDFGCGTGAFAKWLPASVDYFAYDWARGMRERVAGEHPRATVLDELPESLFDHVVAIGVFNLEANWSREQTWETLGWLWTQHTRRTLIVSLYRGHDPRTLAYRPEDAVAFAERLGCRHYALDTTYLDNDMLLELRR